MSDEEKAYWAGEETFRTSQREWHQSVLVRVRHLANHPRGSCNFTEVANVIRSLMIEVDQHKNAMETLRRAIRGEDTSGWFRNREAAEAIEELKVGGSSAAIEECAKAMDDAAAATDSPNGRDDYLNSAAILRAMKGAS